MTDNSSASEPVFFKLKQLNVPDSHVAIPLFPLHAAAQYWFKLVSYPGQPVLPPTYQRGGHTLEAFSTEVVKAALMARLNSVNTKPCIITPVVLSSFKYRFVACYTAC